MLRMCAEIHQVEGAWEFLAQEANAKKGLIATEATVVPSGHEAELKVFIPALDVIKEPELKKKLSCLQGGVHRRYELQVMYIREHADHNNELEKVLRPLPRMEHVTGHCIQSEPAYIRDGRGAG